MRKVLHECCAGTMKGIIIYGYRINGTYLQN